MFEAMHCHFAGLMSIAFLAQFRMLYYTTEHQEASWNLLEHYEALLNPPEHQEVPHGTHQNTKRSLVEPMRTPKGPSWYPPEHQEDSWDPPEHKRPHGTHQNTKRSPRGTHQNTKRSRITYQNTNISYGTHQNTIRPRGTH